MYTAVSPILLSATSREGKQNITYTFISFLPVIDINTCAISMVWSYVGKLIYKMFILVGTVKMSDRLVKEMMGL